MPIESSRTCWACGTEQDASARFCPACGTYLDQRGRSGDAEAAIRPTERRQLTVMFCDLVGSTRLSLELDPESYTELLAAYRDVCVHIVRQWKGYVARYAGDGVLFYFGYPMAAEDDALRAAASAWELAQAVPQLRLPGSVRDVLQQSLQVRVGLHTGLAVVGGVSARESTEFPAVLGAAPNIAAGLQALARPGGVVISEATRKLLPSTVRLKPVDRRDARADKTGVRAYVITGMPRDLVRPAPELGECFVGRTAVLRRILSGIEEARPGGAAYLLVGEPGIGKSRLVQEIICHPRALGISWIELACSSFGQLSPLHPFGTLLAGSQNARGAAAVAAQAGAAPPGRADDHPAADESSFEMSPFERRQQTFARLRSAILSHAPPVGLVLEDFHWADPTTREFIEELLASPDSAGLRLVLTSRVAPDSSAVRSRRLLVEALERLLPGDAAELARATAGDRMLSAFDLAEIVDRAEGVPLYVEEFVRAVLDFDPTFAKSSEGRIPTTLRDSLMSRLDRLQAGRTVALCASVFGRRFQYAHLRALLELAEPELMTALQTLTGAGILLQSGEIPRATFEFRHALLRDTAYQTLLKSERENLHRRVAQLEASGALSVGETMRELLATHHSLGGNFKESVGYWLKAGREASRRSANSEALAHITKGLEDCRKLEGSDGAGAAAAELELLDALHAPLIAVSGWSSPELEGIYARSKELCARVGSEDAEFHLERGRYNFRLLRSELAAADEISDWLLAMAHRPRERMQRRSYLVEALRTKALTQFYRARYADARSLLEEMMRIYDPAEHAAHAHQYGTEPAAVALSYCAWMDSIGGDEEPGGARLEQALGHATAAAHAFSVCYTRCFAASCAQLQGDAQRAAAYADEAIQLANRHGFQYWLAWGRALRGWAAGLRDPQKGMAMINEARGAYLATGCTLVAPYLDALACNLARHAGLAEAVEREQAIRRSTEPTGVMFWEAALDPPYRKR
ncbi:MAG: AAA family ATPase [Hyphomicrobiaceae bacterium]|nr:AAA family ATPase [Hyphomicrobiaceae bacterium]